MLHTTAPTFDDQTCASTGLATPVPAHSKAGRHGRPASAQHFVTLGRRTLTVLPAHDGVRITWDETEILAIEIVGVLALTPEDQADLLRRGIELGDTGIRRLPMRIIVPKALWCNIPCAREPLRITISLEAICANLAITLHARAHRLFPVDGAGAWGA